MLVLCEHNRELGRRQLVVYVEIYHRSHYSLLEDVGLGDVGWAYLAVGFFGLAFRILCSFGSGLLPHDGCVFICCSLDLGFLEEEFFDRDVHYFHRFFIDYTQSDHLWKVYTVDRDFLLRAQEAIEHCARVLLLGLLGLVESQLAVEDRGLEPHEDGVLLVYLFGQDKGGYPLFALARARAAEEIGRLPVENRELVPLGKLVNRGRAQVYLQLEFGVLVDFDHAFGDV